MRFLFLAAEVKIAGSSADFSHRASAPALSCAGARQLRVTALLLRRNRTLKPPFLANGPVKEAALRLFLEAVRDAARRRASLYLISFHLENARPHYVSAAFGAVSKIEKESERETTGDGGER